MCTYYLHVIAGPDSGRTITLSAGNHVLGRSPGSGQIFDRWLLPHHVLVMVADGQVRVCPAAGQVTIGSQEAPLDGWSPVEVGETVMFGATVARVVVGLSCLVATHGGLALGVSCEPTREPVVLPVDAHVRLCIVGPNAVPYRRALKQRAVALGYVADDQTTGDTEAFVGTQGERRLTLAHDGTRRPDELVADGWQVIEVGAMWQGAWYRSPTLLPRRLACAGATQLSRLVENFGRAVTLGRAGAI